ncbi:unnamed protein product [Didymodactylos carnosus]|uniref:Extradiol ring-cleavage dioxygenase class III enzyme subunit B domain-containing protein n=2 Tax=Didymodactylos carnosus TaxID=1234261 RepID=A0A813UX06_9BILA|nr:unnamed protein product [Didymodactylos carnosus]CAF3616465.1 unnamed protein product [Didymodactylos carnosus]
MPVVGIAYLPHGAMILDPDRQDVPKGAESLHSTCMQISEQIASLNPDLLLLSTPHGLNLHQALNIYQPGVFGCKAAGNAEWNNKWQEYSVEVDLDAENSLDLYFHLRKEKRVKPDQLPSIEGMLAFGGLSISLRWGEVIPLYFALHHLAVKEKQQPIKPYLHHVSTKHGPKVVIIAQPKLGLTTDDQKFYRQQQKTLLLQLGQSIRSWCDSSTRRIVVIISGDQSHTHPWSSDSQLLPIIYQPDPSAHSISPMEGNEYAQSFDQTINDWITGNNSSELYSLDASLLVEQAGEKEHLARSCGYTGSLMMQGLMRNDTIQSIRSNFKSSSAKWLLTDFCSCHPTYYGMMAAFYLRNNS